VPTSADSCQPKPIKAMTTLHILSGGAAFGLVSQLEGRFGADTDCRIAGTYNAVGAMRDALLAARNQRARAGRQRT
jgi:hypothetical protein